MIYITGDTHGNIDMRKLNIDNFPEQKTMTKDDLMIVAGDFGHIWYPPEHRKHNVDKYWLEKYFTRDKKFTTAFVDGNHENFEWLYTFPVETWNGGKIHRINDSVIHLMRGQVYEIQGIKIFTFGGARSIDKGSRKNGISWWPQEEPTWAEMNEGLENLDRVNWDVDYVITHTCSSRIKNLLAKQYAANYDDEEPLNKYFAEIEAHLRYKKWFFGHFHKDTLVDDRTIAIFQYVRQLL